MRAPRHGESFEPTATTTGASAPARDSTALAQRAAIDDARTPRRAEGARRQTGGRGASPRTLRRANGTRGPESAVGPHPRRRAPLRGSRRGPLRAWLALVGAALAILVAGAGAAGTQSTSTPRSAELVPAAKLRKAVAARERWRDEARVLRRTLATSPDAELALRVAGIVYDQDWRHMQRCWLSEGYRHAERFERRIVRLNRQGSGASGPAQFMPGTFASTPFARLDLFNVVAQAMATGWMWNQGRRREWAGVGC